MKDPLRRSFVVLATAAAFMALLLALLPAAGHDQLWFLLMGRRWLEGATLYGPEIFDSNPPLIIWLSALCVKASIVSHVGTLFDATLETTLVAKSFVLALGALVAWFCSRLLRSVWRPLLPGEPTALLFAFLLLFFVVPARDLGQRDALVVLLALPYVVAAARQPAHAVSYSNQLIAGILAALAFCLKPQDALLAVAVELTCLFRVRRLQPRPAAAVRATLSRPELLILLAGAGLYLLAIRRFAPLYFTETLPILRNTYWAIGGLHLQALVFQAVELTLLTVCTLLLLLLTRPVAPAASILLIAGLGAFAAYLIQGTGWYYQQLPALDLIGGALALHLLDLQRRHPLHLPGWIVPSLAAVSLLAVGLTLHFTGYPLTRNRAFALTSPDPAFFQSLSPGTSVAILTTSVDEAMMPVEEFHLTWAQRTNNLWLLPAILFSEAPFPGQTPARRLSPDTVARLDQLQHRWMVEDLTRWHPQLILVERCQDPAVSCQILESRHDNLLAWFERDSAFRTLWSHYRAATRRGRFDAYIRLP